MNFFVYQIFFDQNSLAKLDPGFIPFDNRHPLEPELYEFSVIYHYLKQAILDDECYYGFLSPSFINKTGVLSAELYSFVTEHKNQYDAFYFSAGWDQIAYHKNVFYQGEFFHPGFMNASRDFFNALNVNPEKVMEHLSVFDNSVFCNYVVANGKYWKAWLILAEQFYVIYKTGIVPALHSIAFYNKPTNHAVFFQERLHSWLLIENPELRIKPYDNTSRIPVLPSMFNDTPLTRKILKSAEATKCEYLHSGDPDALKFFEWLQKKARLQ